MAFQDNFYSLLQIREQKSKFGTNYNSVIPKLQPQDDGRKYCPSGIRLSNNHFHIKRLFCIIANIKYHESTIDSEGFKGGTRGAPIMPRDAVSWTANVGT